MAEIIKDVGGRMARDERILKSLKALKICQITVVILYEK